MCFYIRKILSHKNFTFYFLFSFESEKSGRCTTNEGTILFSWVHFGFFNLIINTTKLTIFNIDKLIFLVVTNYIIIILSTYFWRFQILLIFTPAYLFNNILILLLIFSSYKIHCYNSKTFIVNPWHRITKVGHMEPRKWDLLVSSYILREMGLPKP